MVYCRHVWTSPHLSCMFSTAQAAQATQPMAFSLKTDDFCELLGHSQLFALGSSLTAWAGFCFTWRKKQQLEVICNSPARALIDFHLLCSRHRRQPKVHTSKSLQKPSCAHDSKGLSICSNRNKRKLRWNTLEKAEKPFTEVSSELHTSQNSTALNRRVCFRGGNKSFPHRAVAPRGYRGSHLQLWI